MSQTAEKMLLGFTVSSQEPLEIISNESSEQKVILHPRLKRKKEHRKVLHVIYPAFRSEFVSMLGFLALLFLAYDVGNSVPGLIVKQKIFSLPDYSVFLHLPLLTIPPFILLVRILFSVFNRRYFIDKRGVEAQEGLIWINFKQPRLRYEDIKAVQVNQSLLGRVLGVGTVILGSAAAVRDEGEVYIRGVADPKAIQLKIQRAIDRRKRRLLKTRIHHERLVENG